LITSTKLRNVELVNLTFYPPLDGKMSERLQWSATTAVLSEWLTAQ